jgi:hypothetical protein
MALSQFHAIVLQLSRINVHDDLLPDVIINAQQKRLKPVHKRLGVYNGAERGTQPELFALVRFVLELSIFCSLGIRVFADVRRCCCTAECLCCS